MVLPDVIQPGLSVVFCGSAAGAVSARRGAYYAGPGNKFWPMLHQVGLTPRVFAPEEYARVLEHGIGLTDLCKTRSGSDVEVGRDGYDVPRLDALIRENAPRVIAFNGVAAGRAALGAFEKYSVQPKDFGGAEAWVLPSTSGAASGSWYPFPWEDVAARIRGGVEGCPCQHERWRVPPTRQSYLDYTRHQRTVEALLEDVAVDQGRWMSVLRCRRCGRHWAEDFLSSGHADISFVYAIETSQPQAWLDAAQPLF